MAYIDFIDKIHNQSKRDYRQRVLDFEKAECAEVAKKWGYDYWDGERQYGFGGYTYDGRWRGVAEDIARHYGLKEGDRILDIGCGKGYLLYELSQVVPGILISGIDISEYAIRHAKEEVQPFLKRHCATKLPYPNNSQDFVVSVTTLHNLRNFELFASLQEIQRVCPSGRAHITVESYRNEKEKANLLYWQLTCETFYTPEEWKWFFSIAGYTGDYGCIYFD